MSGSWGFSSYRSVHMSGVWIHTATTNTITQRWASDLVIKALTFLCSYISVPLTCLAPTASCAVNMRNKEGLSADITDTSVCGDDVLDRDVARQGHVSAHFFPSSPFTWGQLFRTTLTLGLLLQVSASVSVSVRRFIFFLFFLLFFSFFSLFFFFLFSHVSLFFHFFAGRLTSVMVKRPPPHTSNSNRLHNHANRARKSWRSDVSIMMPGWERHTGGSRPMVRRLWVAQTTSTTRAQTSNPTGGYSPA